MNTVLNQIVQIENKNFQYWEEADKFCVEKIFNFSDFMLYKNPAESISNLFLQTNVKSNEYLKDVIFIATDYISLMKSLIDQYLETGLSKLDIVNDSSNVELKQAHQTMFLLMAHSSIQIFLDLQEKAQYSELCDMSLSKKYIAETVAKKQRDYGPNNIAKFGIFGLVVRIHDKIARLENLLSSKRAGVNAVKGETIFDTLFDVIGYSTVALLWINEWFLHPMEIDSK